MRVEGPTKTVHTLPMQVNLALNKIYEIQCKLVTLEFR